MAASTTLRTPTSQQPVQAADLPAATSLAEVPANILSADIAEAIRVRAYELWEQRGRHHGGDAEDWLAAETEILAGRSHDA